MATYLISQATGRQSQSTIRHLLAAGAKIHAIVRNPATIPPALQAPGITIFKGESNDFEQVYAAAIGCSGVFLNTFPIPGLETQQAQTIVDAAKKAGIKQIVATTTFLTGDKAMWDDDTTKDIGLHGYWDSKAKVEEIVRSAGFKTYTILRPGFIHFDYYEASAEYNWPGFSKTGELAHAMDENKGMPQTACEDIGRYAAEAFKDPVKFNGHELDLCSGILTAPEIRDILAKVSGRKVSQRKRTAEEIEANKGQFSQKFHLFFNVKDCIGVIAASKRVEAYVGIPFTPLEDALSRDKDLLLDTIPA